MTQPIYPYPDKVYVVTIQGGDHALYLSMKQALLAAGGDGRLQIAEYTKGRVVEAVLVADVQCEVGGV